MTEPYACCGKVGRISRHESWCPSNRPSTPLDPDAIRRLWSNYVLNGLGPKGGYAAHLVAERVPDLLAEVERLRAHSVTLNSVGYLIAEALSDTKGEEQYVGQPLEQAKRLVAEVERLRTRWRQLPGNDGEVPDASS